MKRVLHVITRLDSGGSAVSTFLGAAALEPGRFESALAVGGADGGGNFLELKRRFGHTGVQLFSVRHLTRELCLYSDAAAFLELLALFRSYKPDIVHTHTSKAGVLGRCAAFAYALLFSRKIKIVHTPHGHVFYGYFSPVKSRFFLRVERVCAKLTDRLVALTEGERRESLERGVGRPSQWAVIHSGVDFHMVSYDEKKRAALRASVGISPQAVVAGFVGRITAVKGLDTLVEAAALLKNEEGLVFLLVGDGDERAALERKALSSGVGDRVRFTGFREDVFEWLQAMDIFVHPSRNEGMGRSLVEAQAAGLPVAATAVCGIPDVVHDAKAGILSPAGDARALAESIGQLARDEGQRRSMGEYGRNWVNGPDENGLPRYSTASMARKLEALYTSLW